MYDTVGRGEGGGWKESGLGDGGDALGLGGGEGAFDMVDEGGAVHEPLAVCASFNAPNVDMMGPFHTKSP